MMKKQIKLRGICGHDKKVTTVVNLPITAAVLEVYDAREDYDEQEYVVWLRTLQDNGLGELSLYRDASRHLQEARAVRGASLQLVPDNGCGPEGRDQTRTPRLQRGRMKLMILGYARHGKDTVAEILQHSVGLKFASSSFAAAEKVMVPFLAAKGITYASLDECYADRVNHRQDWYEQIKAYNTPDSARLAREIYKDNDVYVGIRNVVEFEAARDEGLFDYSIWVDRSEHVPPEPTTSNTMLPSMASYVLDNNGTLEQLKVKTVSLYLELTTKRK